MRKLISLSNLASQIIWRMPLRFGIANLLGPDYTLRCCLFHDIADHTSTFTKGLNVTRGIQRFEAEMRFLTEHYSPIGLQDVISYSSGKKPPRRPVLVTFDDAYASVAEVAGPICKKYCVPATFFVNASLVGNQDLGIDNLVCYVANTMGLDKVRQAARMIAPNPDIEVVSLRQFLSELLPTFSLKARGVFRSKLISATGIRPADLAREAKLYVSADQLRSLVSSGFTIGNHTYTHVHCRILSGGDFDEEVIANQRELQALVNEKVRSFSVPYGASADLSRDLVTHLKQSGHEALFLVESLANTSTTDHYHLYRVSVAAKTDADFFGELEIQPRLRSIRNRLLRRPAKIFY
jgi:peptidoglycan/xylan/chitin deacetylase (PgdA/CDA1 family)